jgi:iron(III) transport system substrate-binding protein
MLSRRSLLRLAALGAAASVAARGRAAQESTWSTQWAEVVAAAGAEGRLSLLTWGTTWGGSGFPNVIQSFEREFPAIKVDLVGESSASVWLRRLRDERRAGTYAFDLAIVQPDAALTDGTAEGMWAPVRPLLFRSDVMDNSAWRNGLDAHFVDAGGNVAFGWEYQVLHAYAINTDLVADGEITTVQDLLDPKWTGRVISSDPRLGLGLRSAAGVLRSSGSEVLRRLLVDQQPTFSVGGRHIAQSLLRGQYPIALGLRPKALAEFQDQEALARVKFLDLPDADFAVTTPILYFDRAPHPAAAQLFANWILTRDGQALLTSSLPTNSARSDVEPFALEGVASAGKTYYEPDHEANFVHTADTQRFVQSQLGRIHLAGWRCSTGKNTYSTRR